MTAKTEAIAAYGAYWQEMEKLYADPTGKSAHLDQYAASAALKNAEADAKRAHDRGRIYTGSVALTDQTVTKVDTSGRIPNATVSSCLDISKWRRVDAKTKKPVSLPANRLTKYLIVSTVEKYPGGWRVTRDAPQGKSC
ncbi:secreted protein/lipoprotein [Streptomyces canus]|uniref:secreted protein/lipoprotein n=1 Tax=Streptomyces canus TaxID=58343 RepID=UPI0033DBB8A3